MIYKNLKILDNVYGGYGLGRLETGKVVFVPFAVKDDVVDIKIKDEKKSFAYAEILQITKSSPYRRDGFCRYIGECGGCSFGFLDDQFELDVKKSIVDNCFRNFEGFKIDSYIRIARLDYRVRCRMKVDKGGLFYKKFNSNELVFIENCPILKKGLFGKLSDLAEYYKDILADISIIENEKGEELIFLDEEIPLSDYKYNLKSKSGLKGLKNIEFDINGFRIPAGYTTFFQTNRFLFSDFQKLLIDELEEFDTVLELYCGSGFFTIPLSHKVRKVIAVDNNQESLNLLRLYANDRVEVVKSDLQKNMPHFKGRFDAVLVDPDRHGLSKKVIQLIWDKRPEKIVYVSCNPQTMARDLKHFLGKYNLEKFTIIDQFYKTYHIESVAVLVRR